MCPVRANRFVSCIIIENAVSKHNWDFGTQLNISTSEAQTNLYTDGDDLDTLQTGEKKQI